MGAVAGHTVRNLFCEGTAMLCRLLLERACGHDNGVAGLAWSLCPQCPLQSDAVREGGCARFWCALLQDPAKTRSRTPADMKVPTPPRLGLRWQESGSDAPSQTPALACKGLAALMSQSCARHWLLPMALCMPRADQREEQRWCRLQRSPMTPVSGRPFRAKRTACAVAPRAVASRPALQLAAAAELHECCSRRV